MNIISNMLKSINLTTQNLQSGLFRIILPSHLNSKNIYSIEDTMKNYTIKCRSKNLQITNTPVIMGILNVTPDSFSDGGKFLSSTPAVDHALQMIDQGAEIIDIGGESTRPGSKPVTPEQQIARTIPVIKDLASQTKTPISIDTTSSKVAQAALAAGASIINDISALQADDKMASLVAQTSVPIVLMHMQGSPGNMQKNPTYKDVVKEVMQFLEERIDFAISAGIERSQIIIDPGIGFGKTVEHNLLLLQNLDQFQKLEVPVLIGSSRKAFIGKILGIDDPADRTFGTAASVAWAVAAGAQIIRVHDVKEMCQVAKLTAAIKNQRPL